jgi:hypothetical protein
LVLQSTLNDKGVPLAFIFIQDFLLHYSKSAKIFTPSWLDRSLKTFVEFNLIRDLSKTQIEKMVPEFHLLARAAAVGFEKVIDRYVEHAL